ncbi:phage tail tape measure protein [uncultured Tateyamaria sp.]|uniref:phage tail tape measure protein n=1 Tax=uncultured Tateyamaria sp. TaxID=455651 RepID=UPI00261B6C11|nr:phage tail tape measure protein [uncultured Tateyamaria sp.]
MDRRTGQRIDGWAHIAQSLGVLFTARVGTRIERRSVGSLAPDLQDRPANNETVLDYFVSIAEAIERSEQRISQARGRLMGAAAMAATLAAPVIVAGNFEEKMIDFAILAEISGDRVAALDQQLDDLRRKTGKGKVELLDGLSAYVGKGLGLDEALASIEATGIAAVATKSMMNEMASSGFSIMDNLEVAPDRLKKAFDVMAVSGKEGSFELAAMARKFPEITAGAKSLKMDGVDAVASLAAALQVAMKAAGSEDQAATNLTNFMGKITAPDTVKKFKDAGTDIEKELKIALERGTDPLEHMLMVIEKMTGGDAFKMGELFADKQVLDFLRAAIPNLEEYQRIRDKAMGADGTLDADAERVLQGFNAQWKLLRDSVTAMLGPAGALLPIFTDLMTNARGFVEQVNAWTQANPELKPRSRYSKVIANWQDRGSGTTKRVTVKAAEKGPSMTLREVYQDREDARKAADARVKELRAGEGELTLELIGDPHARAEAPLNITNVAPDVDGSWVASTVTHLWDYGEEGGAKTTVEAEFGQEEEADDKSDKQAPKSKKPQGEYVSVLDR